MHRMPPGCCGTAAAPRSEQVSSFRRSGVSTFSFAGYMPVVLALCFVWLQGIVFSQTHGRLRLNTGKEIYEAACVACHGPDGKGMPQTTVGFELPSTFPDFSDCNGTTREREADWDAVIHNGGPARGFSQIMPSFRDALTDDQIARVVKHLRTFCTDRAWPLGEMNLPRALFTEKAFPEDEWVLTSSVNATGNPGFTPTFIYEKRFGARNQIEVKAPFSFQRPSPGSWYGGPGDMGLGYKRVIVESRKTGSLFSLSGEATFPTGNREHGLGGGVTVLEGFASYGQLLPRQSFLQFQSGVESPTNTADAPRAVFWRTAAGTSFSQNKGMGRMWTPIVELLADRELSEGSTTDWDLVPQFQVTLSRRQHVRANIGFQFPLNHTAGRAKAIVFYLLWDFFDGGLLDGWK